MIACVVTYYTVVPCIVSYIVIGALRHRRHVHIPYIGFLTKLE